MVDVEPAVGSPATGEQKPDPGFPARFITRAKRNLLFRSRWSTELNGAMGDLGTYIPIVLALALSKDIDLGTTLVFTGIYNIFTGAIYGVPMPVQPMKAIAAAAISGGGGFGQAEIMAAGILTSAAALVLGVTRTMEIAYRFIPLPVVRGIQLAQGLSFAMTAVRYVRNGQDLARGKSLGERPWLGLDGLVLAVVAACFIVLISGAGGEDEESEDLGCESVQVSRRKKLRRIITSTPSAVIVFTVGVVLAIIRNPSAMKELKAGPSRIRVVRISKHAWKQGLIKGFIPQLPLTALNSVIAVCKLAGDLFPDSPPPASVTSVSVTVGAMNLVGCWFGAVPCCHGAGGLAGQYKFGGRSGGCVAALGAAKLVLGVVLGGSLVRVLVAFPVGLLGVLLLFAGLELAAVTRDVGSREGALVMLSCAAVSLVGSSAALGFACGIVVHLLLWLRRKMIG